MSQIRILFSGFIILVLSAATANAQYAYMGAQAGIGLGGSGTWGGNQGCTTYKVPEEVQDIDDQIDELKKMKKEARIEERDSKKELREITRQIQQADAAISTVLKDEVAAGIVTHLHVGISAGNKANHANVCGGSDTARNAVRAELVQGAGAPIPPQFIEGNRYCAQSSDTKYNPAFLGYAELSRPSETSPGKMDPTTCGDSRTTKPGNLTSVSESSSRNQRALDLCKEGMIYLTEWVRTESELKARMQAAHDEQKSIDRQIKELRRDRRQAMKDAREDGDDGSSSTEGGYCATCGGPKLTTFDRVGNIVGSLVNAGATYFGAKYISNNNARLGWPTSPYAITGLGLGSLMYGIYGGGYGAGGIGMGGGCGGGGGGPGGLYAGGPGFGGGAFGYPGGWGPDGGGGAYNPGCGPWGCPGYPGGYPGGGGYPIAPIQGGGYPIASAIGVAGAYTGIYAPLTGATGAIQGGYPIAPIQGGIPISPIGQATYNVLPYPAGGGYPGGAYPGGGGYPGGAYPGGGYPGGAYPGGQPYANTYTGYPQILQQQAAAAAAAAQYQAQLSSAVSLDSRLAGQIALINQQRASIWSSLGTANGGGFGLGGGFGIGGGFGLGGYGAGGFGGGGYGTPTGTILPYPSTGYDPNLGGTTGTTTTGVTPARGRFTN